MVEGKCTKIQRDGNGFGFARLQLHLGKSFQLLFRANQAGFLIMDINLDNFLASNLARVGYIHSHGHPIHIAEDAAGYPGILIAECCVAQSIPKGEQHRDFFGIVIPVADEKSFAVPDGSDFTGPVDVCGRVLQPEWEGFRQLAAGIHPAKQDVGNGNTACLAHHPAFQDGSHFVDPGIHCHGSPVVEHHHRIGLDPGNRLD